MPTLRRRSPGSGHSRLGETSVAARDRARPLVRRGRRSLRQALLARRRLVTAALAAAAVAAGLRVLAPEPADTVAVPVAVADLAAGHLLTDGDLRLAPWPADLAPSGLAARPFGSTLAAPVRRGEPITDARLRGAGLLLGQAPGTGSMALWLSEPTAGLVRAGDRVDVLAGPPPGGLATATEGSVADVADVVAESVLVLATGGSAVAGSASGPAGGLLDPGPSLLGGGGGDGLEHSDLLVVAVDTTTALRLRAVSGVRALSVVVRS